MFLLSKLNHLLSRNANIQPKNFTFHNNLEVKKITHILIRALPIPRVYFSLPLISYLTAKTPIHSIYSTTKVYFHWKETNFSPIGKVF